MSLKLKDGSSVFCLFLWTAAAGGSVGEQVATLITKQDLRLPLLTVIIERVIFWIQALLTISYPARLKRKA